jgi:hypothetical protein
MNTARRDFLFAQVRLFLAVSVFKLPGFAGYSGKIFYTKCEIQPEKTDHHAQMNFVQDYRKSVSKTFDMLGHELSTEWRQNYLSVRQQFFDQGRLLKTYRVFDHRNLSVTVVNIWQDEKAFLDFEQRTEVSKISEAYRKQGFRFEIATSSDVSKLENQVQEWHSTSGVAVFTHSKSFLS